MNNFFNKFKNYGLLELLVFSSAIYVIGMLLWTASTRSAVEEKANTVKSNHKQIVDFINSEINNCGQGDENLKTAWGDPCNGEWLSVKVIEYVNNNMKMVTTGLRHFKH